jgi:hypothetical protein
MPALSTSPSPTPVVVVGGGAHARSWLNLLRRSSRLRAVASVTRDGVPPAEGMAACASLDAALRDYPQAAFAVALPPRSGLEVALCLAAAGRDAVLQAPLHEALAETALPAGAAKVRVAHGWVTLPGCSAVARLLQSAGGGRAEIEVAGLPESDSGDPWEVLVHGLALLRSLLPAAVPCAVSRADDGALVVEADAASPGGGWRVRLCARGRGSRLSLRVDAGPSSVDWSFAAGSERLRVAGAERGAARSPPSAAVRALAQLLPEAERGDGLLEAAAVARLTRRCRELLAPALPLGARAFRQAASLAARRPADLLARLGLRGELPADGGAVPAPLAAPSTPEPFELWAFRASVKPVTFLTVRPEDVERTLSYFDGAACERRERLVHVEAQDRWDDRRDAGEPRVELYISRDAALARRMARLQAEEDPTRALRELGELAGYPACCVDAFARQDDRANNSRNRYYTSARTAAGDGPWPWELNNLHTMTVAFFPCSYRCDAALAWARAALAEMGRAHPQVLNSLRESLARPVLYFDHEHQLAFVGAAAAASVDYRSVALPRGAAPAMTGLAAAVAAGDRLTFDDRSLRVEHSGAAVLVLERTDPGLGFLAPFG